MQPHTTLGSDAHTTLSLISQFQSPRILCFLGLAVLYLLLPFHGVSPFSLSLHHAGKICLCFCFSFVKVHLKLFCWVSLGFLQTKVTLVLCILPERCPLLCDPSSTLVELSEPDLQAEVSQCRCLALRQDFVDCSLVWINVEGAHIH